MIQGKQISAADIQGLSSGPQALAPAHLTDEFTNKDIFGTMRGQCTAVRLRNIPVYEAVWQADSAELSPRFVSAVQGLRWLLEGYSRLHRQRGGQGNWGRQQCQIHSFTHQRTLRLFAFVDWNAHCDLSSVISNPGSKKRLRQCHSQSRQLLLISSDQCQHCNCYSMQPTPGRMHRLTAQHKQDFSIDGASPSMSCPHN